MNFSLDLSIPVITVFVQGLLSFFSPCVLPLIPIYMGYLSGGTRETDETGAIYYNKKKVMVNTFFFVLGVSFAFFLLGFVMTNVGRFFSGNQILFARIGGIIVILFGLYQLGALGTSRVLGGEYRLPIRFEKMSVSPITALIMGFVLSFAWTPCVGPALSTVLIMASTASTSGTGFLLIGVYTLGYVIPFLAVGLFTTQLLDYFKNHKNIMKYTVKIGGVLMILMGIMMFTGNMNKITGYLSQVTSSNVATSSESVGDESGDGKAGTEAEAGGEAEAESAGDGDVELSGDSNAGGTSGDGGSAEAGLSGKESDSADSGTDSASKSSGDETKDSADAASKSSGDETEDSTDASSGEQEYLPAPDFSITDQYGNVHNLSDYKGKIVFLNFWATWCPPCKGELPDIQALYEESTSNEDSDFAVLGVAFPGLGDEQDTEGVKAFLTENGYTFPVLMDESHELMTPYYITAYPTTFIISPDGLVLGYVPGAMTKDIMEDVIDQARELSSAKAN